MSLPRPPTAVLCYNDIVAIGATRELNVRGIQAGRDFAVVGFDDIAEAEYNAPPLTTINADTREMGRRCAESLLGLIRREDPAGALLRRGSASRRARKLRRPVQK